MQVMIDWTAGLEPVDNRRQDPWESLKSMRPDKRQPEGGLVDYMQTKFEIFCMYLPRKGIRFDEQIKAYASGHVKIVECRGVYYLTTIDGVIYERPKTLLRKVG